MKKLSARTTRPQKLLLRREAIATLEQHQLRLAQGALQVEGSGAVCLTRDPRCGAD